MGASKGGVAALGCEKKAQAGLLYQPTYFYSVLVLGLGDAGTHEGWHWSREQRSTSFNTY